MVERGRVRVLVGLLLAAQTALLAGSAALQLASGGIRGKSLGPEVLAACVTALGSLIVVHRPRVRLGAVLVLTGLGFGVGSLAASALDFGSAHALPRPVVQAAFAVVTFSRVLMAGWLLFILWFPDGRFTSRGWRRFALAGSAALAAVALAVWLAGPPDRVFSFYGGTAVPAGADAGPFAGAWPRIDGLSNLLLLLPLVALGSLVGRYRRGGPVVRQQVRWLLAASAVTILAQLTGAALVAADAAPGAGLALGAASQPLPMLAATLAILRYRLWEIDLVVSRALVYGALWAALSALLVLPALAAGLLVGGRGALAAVAIALLVTAAFRPARARLERLAERLVYRHRGRPQELLTGFWERLRTTGPEQIGPLLADAVQSALDVEWARVRSGRTLLPAATAERLLTSPCRVLSGPPPPELAAFWPAPPAAVVPLVAGDELVGVLACGGRRGDPLGARDFELLEQLARGSALRLRNLRLESQLRERLDEIEAQAEELRRSRQRLVGAQDEERRRIERDLHDGVQQQLVSLAVRMRQLARADEPVLADLAAEAEQAVFALQELARGIFPSVLADQGLTAALRTQAARLPLSVRIEADPELAGRRLDRETEAALYFVALEALTNVQKHAPGAAALVRLVREDGGVVLEVCDDGPGLTGRDTNGTGLQNMADRVAAAGGTLAVGPGPGGGTRVRAAVPVPAAAQAPAADSRR